MRQAAGAHELGRHHWVHAVVKQVIRAPPVLRNPSGQDAHLGKMFLPPGLLQNALQESPLLPLAAAFRPLVIQWRDEPGRRPAVARQSGVQDAGRDQQPTAVDLAVKFRNRK